MKHTQRNATDTDTDTKRKEKKQKKQSNLQNIKVHVVCGKFATKTNKLPLDDVPHLFHCAAELVKGRKRKCG